MSKTRNVFSVCTMLIAVTLLLFSGGCKEDPIIPRDTVYTLKVKDVLGVMGTATFTETSSTITTIDITLVGAPSGIHPAHLCMNSAVEGGPVVIVLNPVDRSGKSSTVVTKQTYAQLIAYEGYIEVVESDSDYDVVLAVGDIGGNVITTTNKTYPLAAVGTFGVSGSALFEKRLNGNTLVTISLTGVIAGDIYPATVNLGSVASVGGGPIVKTLVNVNGTTGKGYTNIRNLNNGTFITYDNWLVYDGYINIYQAEPITSLVICQGNIGSN